MDKDEYGKVLQELMSAVPPEAHAEFIKEIKHLNVPANYMIHEQGKVCKNVFFIETGLARVFYYNNEGKDITDYFGPEGNFIAVVETFFKGGASNYNIQTLEDSVLISMDWRFLESMLNKYIQLERFGRLITMKILEQTIARVNAIQFQTAQERYSFMMERYPDMINRVQQRHIASYLGITPETLSRIRKSHV